MELCNEALTYSGGSYFKRSHEWWSGTGERLCIVHSLSVGRGGQTYGLDDAASGESDGRPRVRPYQHCLNVNEAFGGC